MIVFCPWPFAKWGIDIIGPLPTGLRGVRYAEVVVDYFTKWAEAKALMLIIEENLTKFIKEKLTTVL